MRLARQQPQLQLEQLEAREVPALTIQLDYSFDTNGFFNDSTRRAVLQQAVNEVAARIDPGLGAITPSGSNTWTATFYNPATGYQQSVSNLSVGTDTIVLFVGGRDLSGSEAGVGGYGGWSASGSSSWVNYIPNRGRGGFAPWGGALSFDTWGTSWYFGTSGNIPANTIDFYSVAQHELGHMLGIGTSSQWYSLISNGVFTGANASSLYGGPVPVQSGGAHWASGVPGFGCNCPSCIGTAAASVTASASLDPSLPYATRVGFSELDFAALKDIGWNVTAPSTYSPPATPVSPTPAETPTLPPPPPATPVFTPTTAGASGDLVAISGGAGSLQIFQQGSDRNLYPLTSAFTPFAGYSGTVRSAVGDYNGDGYQDIAVGTGPGPNATVMIYNGKDYSLLVGPTVVVGGFTGGVFLASGDVNRDGSDELAISADSGGGPRVTIYAIKSGTLVAGVDFFAFDAPTFTGGVRVALGDVNKDGYADLVITAGPGGGPRVSTYSGAYAAYGQLVRLIPDFYAFDWELRTGAFVAVADLNQDGYAEIVFSADVGGSSRAIAYSGALLTANPGVDPMTLPMLFSQYTTWENLPYGTRVTVKDLNADGKNEMLITTAMRTDSSIRTISSSDILSGVQPTAFWQKPIGDAWDVMGLYLG